MKQTSQFCYKRIFLVRILVIRYYYHPDHLGSTSLITNESGGIAENIFYDPYGRILDPYGTILLQGTKSRYQYEGKEFSQATEDYDFHFRKYNPEIGIFTQPEQLFPNVYDPQQLNRYSFERRNPYKYVDPLGLWAVLLGVSASGAAGGSYGSVGPGLLLTYDPGTKSIGIGGYFSFLSGAAATTVAEGDITLDVGLISKANKISDVSGSTFAMGSSISAAYSVGYDYLTNFGKKGGVSSTGHVLHPVGAGLGALEGVGGEMHAAGGYTWAGGWSSPSMLQSNSFSGSNQHNFANVFAPPLYSQFASNNYGGSKSIAPLPSTTGGASRSGSAGVFGFPNQPSPFQQPKKSACGRYQSCR